MDSSVSTSVPLVHRRGMSIARAKVPVVQCVNFQGHIVVCGHIDFSLGEFLRGLRRQALSKSIPVVIIVESMPADDLLQALACTPDVFVIIGSLGDFDVLDNANLVNADYVLLLSDPFSQRISDVHQQVVQVDFENIVNLLALENYVHARSSHVDTNTLVEIIFIRWDLVAFGTCCIPY